MHTNTFKNETINSTPFFTDDGHHESVRIRICKVLFFDYNHEAMMIQNYALIVDINIIIMSASMLSQDLCCCNSFDTSLIGTDSTMRHHGVA